MKCGGHFLPTALSALFLVSCSGGTSQLQSIISTPAQSGSADLVRSRPILYPEPLSKIPPALRTRGHDGAHPAWMKLGIDDAAEGGALYVSQEMEAPVYLYPPNNRDNGAPLCSVIPGVGPLGLATDPSGTLYVASSFRKFIGVQRYGPNCGAPGNYYADLDGIPDKPAIDGSTLYVSNLIDTGEVAATIDVYVVSSASTRSQLSSPDMWTGVGLALDSHHNLFWSGGRSPYTDGLVVEFPNGKMPGHVLVKIGHDFPGGVVIDKSDNLLLIDQNKKSIYLYSPPYTAPAYATIALKGTTIECALSIHGTRLYCLDYEVGSVDVYSYPAGTYIYSFTNGIDANEDPTDIIFSVSGLTIK